MKLIKEWIQETSGNSSVTLIDFSLVHRQIIETVCGPTDDRGSVRQLPGQYFLITPKLLPDLQYHENMRVLTIYNGEGLPEDKQWKSCRAEVWSSNSSEVVGA